MATAGMAPRGLTTELSGPDPALCVFPFGNAGGPLAFQFSVCRAVDHAPLLIGVRRAKRFDLLSGTWSEPTLDFNIDTVNQKVRGVMNGAHPKGRRLVSVRDALRIQDSGVVGFPRASNVMPNIRTDAAPPGISNYTLFHSRNLQTGGAL